MNFKLEDRHFKGRNDECHQRGQRFSLMTVFVLMIWTHLIEMDVAQFTAVLCARKRERIFEYEKSKNHEHKIRD